MFLWAGVASSWAENTTLHSTFTWPRIYDDSMTYNVTVYSSPIVKGGTFWVTDAVGDIRAITTNPDGSIINSGYYGGPATIWDNNYAITFQFGESYDWDLTYAGYYYTYPDIPNLDLNPTPIVFNFTLTNHDTGVVLGYSPQTMSTEFTWTDITNLFGFDFFFNTDPQYTPLNYAVNIDFYLGPPPDKSVPPCNPGCATCKGMAGYSFDMAKAGLRITDTPVSYSPPVGTGVAFTTTYNQRDVGQVSTLPVSTMGPNWTYNWQSYIIGTPDNSGRTVQRFVPGGGLEDYVDFVEGSIYYDGTSYHYGGTFAQERQSQAVLTWDPANNRYLRVSPGGATEIYGHEVTSHNQVYYLLTQQLDAQGNGLVFTYDSQNRLTTVTDALGQATTLSYNSGNPMEIASVTDPFGRSAQFLYDDQGRLIRSTDPMGIKSIYGYDNTGFLSSLTTPYGTTSFSTDSDNNHQAVQATNPLGQTERVELRYNSIAAIPDSATSIPTATGLVINNSGLSSFNTYYWDRKAYSSTPDYTKAHIWHWLIGPNGLTNVAQCEKKALEGWIWTTYAGQTTAGSISDDDYNLPAVTARVLDDGSTQASYASYSSLTGNITQSVDPVGRTTNFTYAANGIDVTQISQTDGASQDVLNTMTYNGQHEPLTVTDASGQTTTMTYNAAGQLLTRTDALSETTTLAYDDSGYLTSVTGPVSGATTTYTYDSAGRVQTITDSEDYTVTTAYDNLDRPIQTTYPDSTSDQTVYNNAASPLDIAQTIDRQGPNHNQSVRRNPRADFDHRSAGPRDEIRLVHLRRPRLVDRPQRQRHYLEPGFGRQGRKQGLRRW